MKKYLFLFSQLIDPEKCEAHGDKATQQYHDPLCNADNALGFQVHEEVGIDQGRGGFGNQDRRVKPKHSRLNEDEDDVRQRKEN